MLIQSKPGLGKSFVTFATLAALALLAPGVYAMAAGDETTAAALLQALEGFANEGGMFSEQVWEDTGEGTGSATPLVWAHAEYLVLWRSWHERAVFDLPDLVAQRYAR